MDTTITLLIGIHKDHTSIVNSLWTIFQAVSLAVVGFVFAQEFARKNALLLAGVTVAFLVFAVANHQAIDRSQKLISAAASELNAMGAASTDAHIKKVLSAYEAQVDSNRKCAHFVFSAIVVGIIWMLHLAARFKPKQQDTPADELTKLRINIAKRRLALLEANKSHEDKDERVA